jgi:hypothetical protein
MKLKHCKNCKFLYKKPIWGSAFYYYFTSICTHPALTKERVVYGAYEPEIIKETIYCSKQNKDGICDFYERIWWKFWA